MGNIYSKRDWGHAEDYVERQMWLILQQKKPQDFVISTGRQFTVKQFIEIAASKLNMKLNWKGKGIREKCYYNNEVIIEINKKYFRPSEVESLCGDSSRARKFLIGNQKNQLIL